MLDELPSPENKIISNNPKDQRIADQLGSILNWKVVKSRSDKHPEYGYPMGHVLCRNLEEAEQYVKNSEFNDLYIDKYND